MVPHYRRRVVQQVGRLCLALPFEYLLHQLDVVPPGGLDEELLRGGALSRGKAMLAVDPQRGIVCIPEGPAGSGGRDMPRVPLHVPSRQKTTRANLVDGRCWQGWMGGKWDCLWRGFRCQCTDPYRYRMSSRFQDQRLRFTHIEEEWSSREVAPDLDDGRLASLAARRKRLWSLIPRTTSPARTGRQEVAVTAVTKAKH